MSDTVRQVQICEGNETISCLMTEVLSEVGMTVDRSEAPKESADELADLLVVDVDSGLPDLEQITNTYREAEKPVVFCGLRHSREKYSGETWLDRPFSTSTFLNTCLEVLGMDSEDLVDRVPGSLTLGEEEPITRELQYDEAVELERELGLEPGALGSEEVKTEEKTAYEVLDLDDAEEELIIEVEELEYDPGKGGALRGKVERRRIDTREIEESRRDSVELRGGFRRPTFSQTMPDSPSAIGTSDEDSTIARESTDFPLPPEFEAENELQGDLRAVARMLADSWHRIGMAARVGDRAERIERVLKAMFERGIRGAGSEINRIPIASGFSGNLRTLTLIDLLRTARDRRLRGRLELSLGDETFVLYLDASYLEDVDNLSGPVEHMLLDILYENGALTEETHQKLLETYARGDMMEPVEMRVLSEGLVTEDELKAARTERAKRLFRHVCGARDGTFAFLEVQKGDGQPWPINPLSILVDELLLEIMRESSFDTGDSRATARTRLVLDATRAAAVDPARLTKEEREVLLFFRDAETVGEARERLRQAGRSPEEIDRVVNRLKKLELLKRSNPNIRVPDAAQQPHRQSDTVVSEQSDLISRAEQFKASQRDAHNRTTSTKPVYDVPPEDLDDAAAGFQSDPDDVQTRNLKPSQIQEADEEPDSDSDSDMERVIDEAMGGYGGEPSEPEED